MPYSNTSQWLEELIKTLREARCDRGVTLDMMPEPIYLIGNGGSAAVAMHIANDLVKHGRDAHALADPVTMACLSNDFGWERVFSSQMRNRGTLIAISSSGQSRNILNAMETVRRDPVMTVTLSGFEETNPLRAMGHYNYYVPSKNYGLVEICHLAILHSIVNPG